MCDGERDTVCARVKSQRNVMHFSLTSLYRHSLLFYREFLPLLLLYSQVYLLPECLSVRHTTEPETCAALLFLLFLRLILLTDSFHLNEFSRSFPPDYLFTHSEEQEQLVVRSILSFFLQARQMKRYASIMMMMMIIERHSHSCCLFTDGWDVSEWWFWKTWMATGGEDLVEGKKTRLGVKRRSGVKMRPIFPQLIINWKILHSSSLTLSFNDVCVFHGDSETQTGANWSSNRSRLTSQLLLRK